MRVRQVVQELQIGGTSATLTTTRRELLAGLAAMAALPVTAYAQAEAWPQKPVRVLVGFAAGGNIDNLARLTCARLSETFGQQFVVENRVGAMGSLAADAVAKAPADGYMLFWAGTGTVSIFPAMGKTPYDTAKDFEPVSLIGTSPQVLIVNVNVPAKSVAEFIAHVKTQPGKLSYGGGGGPGSVSNLLMQLFLKRAGLEMIPVSYRGTAPALTDLIGGHIPAMFIPLPEALAQAKSGKIRILGISSGTRAPQAPDVPTIAESGFPGYDIVSWNGMLAPAGTPKEIIDKIAAEFVRAAKDPAFIAHMDKYGADPRGLAPQEFAKFLEQDRALWADAVKLAGVKLR
ncbi:MAG: tripartite tricarboxylate transporter substrate binding protein [Rhizobiales bacterium]|nr:tripartite tricarboxylate transporter substrate binding protein [Hyphomicrobiales bacterium]